VPVVKQNSYVIMLKPTADEPQINALLQKYNLKVVKSVPALQLLRVEKNDATPSTAPAAPAQGGNQALAQLLTPQLIRDLRKEPIIDSAFVESALTAKSIPQAKNTTVVSDSVTYSWHWKDGLFPVATPSGAANNPAPLDGNWGLKAMRLPPAWTILQRYRATHPNQPKPKLAFIDTGFSTHEDLAYNALRSPDGTTPPNVMVTSSVSAPGFDACEMAHGNHVAGIASAIWGNGIGIDGVIPQAKVDAVPFSSADEIDDSDTNQVAWEQRTSLFMDVLSDLSDYLDDSDVHPDGLRVINLSLGYNFIADGVVSGDPSQVPDLREHIAEEAKPFAHLMLRYQDTVLFVTAAGNDSEGASTPYNTMWSSPLTWAATQSPAAERPNNVLVVEAADRNGLRAEFSNIGGDVAAPGVNILSTLLSGGSAYGVCSGTSQASPHVAALATVLFELDPTKKPADIVNIIKSTAVKQASGPGAPVVDALEAVLKLSPDNLTRLADLNQDGKVDAADLAIFIKQYGEIANNRTNGAAFTEDLNGDGVVDANECSWPLIDLNGSGMASLLNSDARSVEGVMRTDLQVLQLAWTDKTKDFNTAVHAAGLDAMIAAVNSSTAATKPGTGCR
jgi:subtilisin family serine protease